MNPNTNHFEDCDMCHIGLGVFDYRIKGSKSWQRVKGEPKFEWKGEIERTQLEERVEDENYKYYKVRYRRRVTKLCGDCYERYALPQLRAKEGKQ